MGVHIGPRTDGPTGWVCEGDGVRRVGLVLFLALVGCTASEPPPVVVDRQGLVPALVCPGGPGCERGKGDLISGSAVRSITPAVEPFTDDNNNTKHDDGEAYEDLNGNGEWDAVWLAGFGPGRAAQGVHDDLYVRAVTFRQGDVHFAWVVVDVVGYFHSEVVRIREAARAAGLDFDHILVGSTHNHEGPDTMGIWGRTTFSGGINDAYMDFIVAEAVEALKEANEKAEPVQLSLVQTEAPELVADSREPNIIDQTMTAIRLADQDDAVKTSIVIWGNHPEALSDENQEVTSDYPNFLRKRLEVEYPGSNAIFFPGNLGGLMNPLRVVGCPDSEGNATCSNGQFEKAQYIGEGAAERVIEAFGSAALVEPEAPTIGFRRQRILFALQNRGFITAYAAGVFDRPVHSPEGRRIPRSTAENISLAQAQAGALRTQSEVNAFDIGPLHIVTAPGELYPELWLAGPDGNSLAEKPANADIPDAELPMPLSLLGPDRPMRAIINQGNDSLGYIIPKTQFDLQEPYAYRENGQYGEENSMGPDSAPFLEEAIRLMYELDNK